MPLVLTINNITKKHSSEGKIVNVLENFNLKVNQSELLVIMGPSGCGKSTLLKIISGIEKADSGSIVFANSTKPKVSLVTQEYSIFPWLTVRQNIEFGIAKNPERTNISNHYLEVIGLYKKANNYPYQLSGGQKQRVAVAQVLAYKPNIILMDEPFSALDSGTRLQMQNLLLKIWQQEHPTIIFVTHDKSEAERIKSHRIVNLYS